MRNLSLFASTAMAAMIAAGAVHAQSAGPATTIEELVVTAEKREQNLQDVPVAISAFTSKQRDLVGINSIQDLTNFTPGRNPARPAGHPLRPQRHRRHHQHRLGPPDRPSLR